MHRSPYEDVRNCILRADDFRSQPAYRSPDQVSDKRRLSNWETVVMPRLARWCLAHRRIVVSAWLLFVVAAVFIGSSTGSNYSASYRLSGTQSATAQSLLQRAA